MRERILTYLVSALLWTAAGTCSSQERWAREEHPRRVRFSVPANPGKCVVLTLSHKGDLSGRSPLVVKSPSGIVAHRIVFADSNAIHVLVKTSGVDEKSAGWHLYYGSSETNRVAADDPTLRENRPIRMETYGSAGAIPTTWERLRYMLAMSRSRHGVRFLENFGRIEVDAPSGERRSGFIVEMSTVLLVRQSGLYRFAIDCEDAGFVTVDNELAAEWPGEHDDGAWQAGPAIYLRAGVHTLNVYSASGRSLMVQLGWLVPGASGVERIPPTALLAGAQAEDVCYEEKGQTLRADFSIVPEPAYSFRGVEGVFTPVSFRNTTAMSGSAPRYRWDFGDGSTSDDPNPKHIYRTLGSFTVRLAATRPDDKTSEHSALLDTRMSCVREHIMDAEIRDVPAVAFAHDPVLPRICVTPKFSTGIALTTEWRMKDWMGNLITASTQRVVHSLARDINLRLPERSAGELSEIDWTVLHEKVRLACGKIVFSHPPFPETPASVVGDRLFGKNGTQLVLVPTWRAGKNVQGALSPSGDVVRAACVSDGYLFPGGAEDERKLFCGSVESFATATRLSVSGFFTEGWHAGDNSYAPLEQLVRIPQMVTGSVDVVVISLGSSEIAHRRNAAAFERELAALADVFWATRRCKVIWVTPPCRPENAAAVRPFAVAVRRLAAVREMPTVDLFSAFAGSGSDSDKLFRKNTEELSPSGRELAARLVTRALEMK